MIEFVWRQGALLPVDVARALDDQERERSRISRISDQLAIEADTIASGYDPRTFPRMTPEEALQIHFRRIRKSLGPDELARRYACRTCRVAWDDTYKASCRSTGVAPCFVSKRFKGCAEWKPKPLAAATGGAKG